VRSGPAPVAAQLDRLLISLGHSGGGRRRDIYPIPGATYTLYPTHGAAQALEIMEEQIMPGSDALDVRDRAAVAARIKGSVASKMYGFEDLLAPLIAQARPYLNPTLPAGRTQALRSWQVCASRSRFMSRREQGSKWS